MNSADEKLTEDLKIFKKYYDAVRLIDPFEERPPLSDGETEPVIDEFVLQHFGDDGGWCRDCICRKAVRRREAVAKAAVVDGTVFMMTALPVEVDGRWLALELVKAVVNEKQNALCDLTEDRCCQYMTKLKDMAFCDALTGLYNRRYIDKQLSAEIAVARHRKQPVSLIMLDIDNFKRVNDEYGHMVGDEVLKGFADKIRRKMPANGSAWGARYGGEEFLLVLPECSAGQAGQFSETLREAIAAAEFSTTAGPLRLTASFGVYTSLAQGFDPDQLLDRVDDCLCRAKRKGRNRTVAASAADCLGSN